MWDNATQLQRPSNLEPPCRPSRYETVQYVPGELPHIELERQNGDEALERVLRVFNIPSLLGLAGCDKVIGKLNPQHKLENNHHGIFSKT